MSARSSAVAGSRAGRRTLAGAVVAALATAGFMIVAPPASAAGSWFVAPGGVNNASCGTSASPCATVTFLLAKPAVVAGDTVNVAAGTYTDRPNVSKAVTIIGQGAGVTFNGGNAGWAMASTVPNTQTLTLTNLTLTNGNYPSGGGLPIASGKVIANDVTITGNKSANGGGVYIVAGATFTMNGGSVSNNTATASAGAVYAAGALTTSGGSISNNTAVNAGAVLNASTMTVDGTTISGNTANGAAAANGGNGGAIYNAAVLTVKNATLSGNKVVAGTGGGIAGYGGAIFSANLAANAPVVTLTDTTIDGGGVSGDNAVAGGAIATYPNTVGGGTTSRVDATRLTVSNNNAQIAGGVLTSGAATFTDSSLTGNDATNASLGVGGGLYALASLTLDSTDVTGNTAGVTGGGLAVGSAASATVRNGSSISANAAVSGGGILNAGTLAVTGSHVDGNSASFQGGGLYNGSSLAADAPRATLTGSSVDDNDAALGGGGIVTLVRATLSVTDGQVNGNSALGGAGVTVGDGAPASFDGTDFVDNTASNLGGGAILSAGTLALTRVRISNNHATHTTGNTGVGAGIYSGSSTDGATTKLTISRSEISGNDGYAGSALVTASTGANATNTTSIDNSTIVDNTNTSTIGAIELFHPLTLTNSTVTGNTATGANAGALAMLTPSTVGVAGTILSGNGAKSCSGAVNDGGYNLTDPGDAGCGFTAGKHDQLKAPQLGVLADNGGRTQTRLPASASPVLDAVPTSTATGLTDAVTGAAVVLCASGGSDQRDLARPQGARCDVGSVERAQDVPTVDGPSPVTYAVGVAGAPATYTTTGSPQPSLAATGLPAGVVFHDNGDGTGTLSGTPAAHTGGSYTVAVTATNEAGAGTKSVTLEVNEAPELTGPSAATYTVGQPGGPDEFHAVHGHPDPTLSTDSALPGGVTFTAEDGGKGHLAGTPQVGSGGVYPITIKGSNGVAPDATFPFTLTVNEGPTLTGPDNEAFTVGSAGSSAQYVSTGTPTPTLTAAGLPAGLGFTAANGKGRITGTPATHAGGEYDVTVTATNGIGTDATKTTHVTVHEAPALTGPTSARFVAGIASTIAFSSTGYPQADLTVSGDLPAGLTFTDHHNGTATISGTAPDSVVGDHQVTVRASNGIAPDSVTHLTISVVPHVGIVTTSLPEAGYRMAYDAQVAAEGGQPPYSFQITGGSLPTGLSMDGTGHITGTPTGSPGTSTFTVQVTDGDHPAETATKTLTLTVGKGQTTLDVDPVLLKASAGGGLLSVQLTVGTVHATLTGGFPTQPIAGQPLVFKAGTATVCTGTTTASGEVTCPLSLLGILAVTLNLKVTATYAGNSTWAPSSGTGNLIG
jgi:hypothetical protein